MERQIARHMMELADIDQINKKKFKAPNKKAKGLRLKPDDGRKTSYFALHWRAYLDPESNERKALHSKLLREFEMELRKKPTRRIKPTRVPRILPWPTGHRLESVRRKG